MPSSGFFQSSHELLCDGVSLAAIADAEGTPLYVYSAALIRDRFRAIDDRVCGVSARAALRAQGQLDFRHRASCCASSGSAADANSIWEIDVARRAGFEPRDIVFTGVGKSGAELECAVPLGLKAINVESAGELARIEAIAARLGCRARVAVRINPDIDAKSHPHISTGLKINKFGVAGRDRPAKSSRRSAAGRRSSSSRSTCTSDRRSRRSSRCAARRRSLRSSPAN